MVKRTYKKNYSLIFFGFIILYNFIITNKFEPWTIDGNTHAYHLVDFSMGFCSRFLPGAIYNFLFDDTSIEAVSLFATGVFVICAGLISLMFGKVINAVDVEERPFLVYLLLVSITGISTLPMYVYRMGSLDSYWFLLFLLSIIVLSKKWLYFLIVPITLMMVMVNYGSLVNFIPFLLLIMIYKTTTICEKKETTYLWITIVVSAVCSVILTIYFVLYEQSNLTYTFEEFSEILNARGFGGESVYYGSNLYDIEYYEEVDYDVLNGVESPILHAIAFVYYRMLMGLARISIEKAIAPMLLALPMLVLIFSCFNRKIKDKEEPLMKRMAFCGMIAMFFGTLVGGLLFSTDVVRFLGHAYTLLFFSFIYVIYKEKKDFLQNAKDCVKSVPKTLVALYSMCYFFTVFDPMG